jgi:hypothetical protein
VSVVYSALSLSPIRGVEIGDHRRPRELSVIAFLYRS